MLTILAFILVIGVIIFVHELGHFLAAKSVGIRVETFSLGYPPKMIGRRHGETEYCIGWIPLGGFVKMSGMIDESLQGGRGDHRCAVGVHVEDDLAEALGDQRRRAHEPAARRDPLHRHRGDQGTAGGEPARRSSARSCRAGRPRRPGCSRATASSRSTGSRSRPGTTCSRRSIRAAAARRRSPTSAAASAGSWSSRRAPPRTRAGPAGRGREDRDRARHRLSHRHGRGGALRGRLQHRPMSSRSSRRASGSSPPFKSRFAIWAGRC